MAIYKRLIKMPDGTKQRADVYWFKFQWKGRSIRKSTGQKNPRVARQIEAAHRTALAKSAAGIKDLAPAPTFQEFTKRFLSWVEVERAEKPRTILFYKTRVGLLLKYEPLKTMLIDQIDAGTVARLVEWRKGCARVKVIRRSKGLVEYAPTKHVVSVCGINRELAVLRRVLNIAHEWKVIPSVPRVHLLPGEKISERVVTHEEQQAYLEAAPESLREFTTVAVGTGFRPEEILTMRWENVRFDPVGAARLGYVHNPNGKTARAKRNVPMSADVRAVLEKRHEAAGSARWGYVFEGPTPPEHLSYSAIRGQHERTMKRLKSSPDTKNFPKTRIYDWRHTALTRLGESGADSFVIQKVAGHSSIITSSRYVHPTSERLEDAFDRLQAYNDGKHEKNVEAARNAG